MSNIATKLTYLNGTKQAIKQAINEDFEVIDDNTTFREYADEISSNNAKYKDLIPKETTNATNTLDISNSSGLDKALVTQYGNTYQETTTGKNLLDISTLVDGYVLNNGNFNSIHEKEEMRSDYIAVKPNTTYTFKIFGSSWNGITYDNWFGVGEYNSSKTFIIRDTMTTGTQTYITFTTSANTEYVAVSARGLASATKVQLEEGSTATDWEKYTNGASPNPDYPQEIVNISGKSTLKDVGKQLFDKSTAEVGKYVTDNGELGSSNTFSASDYIQVVSGNSYTYSGCHMYDTFASGGAYYDENKEFVSFFKMQYSGTITIPQNAKYVRFSMRHSENDEDTFMFEFRTTASTYESYKEQSFDIDLPFELCKIGDYQDRIYPLNGKWYLEKKIGKVVLNGSESWTRNTSYSSAYLLPHTSSSPFYNKVGNYGGYSNYFIVENSYTTWTADGKCGFNSTGAFWIRNTDANINTVELFKSWLSTNNVIVYYVLATPTTEEITENNYPTLYNQLNNIKLFEGVNHLTFTNESGLDVEFDIEYYKDWKLD